MRDLSARLLPAHPGSWRRRVLLAGVAVSVGLSTPTFLTASAQATTPVGPPVRAGDLVLVDATNPNHELTNGGSATRFTLRLPADATCPGDSENDQWRVQSFLVPATDDPGALHYGEIGPDGDGRWAMYSEDTHAFVHILTLANSQAGQPGRIDTMPTFSFVLFPPGTLPDGRYRVGIACTWFRTTAKYWDTVLVLTTSPTDTPGNLVWRVAEPPHTSKNEPNSSFGRWAVVGAGLLGVVAITLVLSRRNGRRIRPLAKEHS